MSLSFDDPSIASQYRDVRLHADGMARIMPMHSTNKRIVLRSDTDADASLCERVLAHAGYRADVRPALKTSAVYLQVYLRY